MTVKAITSFRWPIDGKMVDVMRGQEYDVGPVMEKQWIGQNRAVDIKPSSPEEADAELLKAVNRLETGNDEHWTKSGLPAVHAVETFLGRDTNRVEINRVAPDIKRPG